jgi:hypothetical protein
MNSEILHNKIVKLEERLALIPNLSEKVLDEEIKKVLEEFRLIASINKNLKESNLVENIKE